MNSPIWFRQDIGAEFVNASSNGNILETGLLDTTFKNNNNKNLLCLFLILYFLFRSDESDL